MRFDAFESRSLPLSDAPALAAGEAHLWRMRLAGLPVMESAPPARRADLVRQRRMGQRFVLRLLLGAYLGVPGRDVALRRDSSGKPALAAPLSDSGLTFNVSHVGELLAVAVARDVPVGVDIEPRDRPVRARSLARRWFSVDEAERIERIEERPGQTEFLRRWSVREAVIKARGGTIAEHVRDVTPSADDPGQLTRLPRGWPPAGEWDIRELDGDPDLVGFLAAPARLGSTTGYVLKLAG
jgi:4'-phosphopantetheinyl transferase